MRTVPNGKDVTSADRTTSSAALLEAKNLTPEQISLAWSPKPPFVSTGAGDCRMGGSCLDFYSDTPRSRWVRARYWWLREQKATWNAAEKVQP